MLAIVVAYSTNRVIGYRGGLPWRLPSDLRRFRELTVGHTVIMGRRTFESLPPAHRPLRDRRNVVISSNPSFRAPDVEVHSSLDSALAPSADSSFVIGGGSVYTQALAHVSRVYATEVDLCPAGDAFFPELPAADWRCVHEHDPMFENDLNFVFRTYDRAT